MHRYVRIGICTVQTICLAGSSFFVGRKPGFESDVEHFSNCRQCIVSHLNTPHRQHRLSEGGVSLGNITMSSNGGPGGCATHRTTIFTFSAPLILKFQRQILYTVPQ